MEDAGPPGSGTYYDSSDASFMLEGVVITFPMGTNAVLRGSTIDVEYQDPHDNFGHKKPVLFL